MIKPEIFQQIFGLTVNGLVFLVLIPFIHEYGHEKKNHENHNAGRNDGLETIITCEKKRKKTVTK